MRIIYYIGKPKRMKWFRLLYYKISDRWYWGIIPFIKEVPSEYDKVVHKKEIQELLENVFGEKDG